MRCIVTGGAGFIGNNIVKKLVARGDDVTVIDNLNTGKEENLKSVIDKITFLKDSILNRLVLKKCIFKIKIESKFLRNRAIGETHLKTAIVFRNKNDKATQYFTQITAYLTTKLTLL